MGTQTVINKASKFHPVRDCCNLNLGPDLDLELGGVWNSAHHAALQASFYAFPDLSSRLSIFLILYGAGRTEEVSRRGNVNRNNDLLTLGYNLAR